MVELLKKPIHKSQGKLGSVQTVNAKCGMKLPKSSINHKGFDLNAVF